MGKEMIRQLPGLWDSIRHMILDFIALSILEGGHHRAVEQSGQSCLVPVYQAKLAMQPPTCLAGSASPV